MDLKKLRRKEFGNDQGQQSNSILKAPDLTIEFDH